MNEDSHSTIKKSASSFFYGTLLSRISGLIRDITLAYFFGSKASIAAFMVAFRFANLFRRLLGEASLKAGFIPHFENIRKKNQHTGAIFFRDLFFSMSVFLLVIVIGCEFILLILNFFSFNTSVKEIIHLTALMLPGVIFMCLYGLNSALLQCEKKYFLPAVAPLFFNLVWIVSLIVLKDFTLKKAVIGLSIAVVIASIVQWFITSFASCSFFIKSLKFKEFFCPQIFSESIKKLIKPIVLGIIGIGAMQLNTALDSIFARIADLPAPAYLWYATRLQQLPLALFAIAISGAVLPPLTRAFQNNNIEKYINFLSMSINRATSFMISSSFAIIALGGVAINLLFGRGMFDQVSIVNTLLCLWGYSIGLLFATFVLIVASAFYAQKQYYIPTKATIYSVICNILLNSIFIFAFNMKAPSIAIATSMSSIFNCLYLLKNMKYKIFDKNFYFMLIKTIFCNVCAFISVVLIGNFIFKDPTLTILLKRKINVSFPTALSDQLINFIVLALIYLAVLAFCAFLIKAKNILEILKLNKRKN